MQTTYSEQPKEHQLGIDAESAVRRVFAELRTTEPRTASEVSVF